MATGTISAIRDDKGFGFLKPHDGGEDLFFHASATPWRDDAFGPQLVRLDVSFDVGTDERSGRERAINVRPAR